MIKIKTSDVIFRENLYPRIIRDHILVQKYSENIEMLPPIELNQNNELIDGWHRWTAHKTMKIDEISVIITPTKSDAEFLALAINRNSSHGSQLSDEDKKSMAMRLFNYGGGYKSDEIAKILSVSIKTVQRYLKQIKDNLAEEQKKIIFNMWMACYTQEEISERVNLSRDQVQTRTEVLCKMDTCPKSTKLSAFYQDPDWQPQIYNIWPLDSIDSMVNYEKRIVDNLIYIFTKPFDIVIDPFTGNGTTIDVCRKRMRRYYTIDIFPIPAREHEIRIQDIKTIPPLNKNWSEVSLTYLNPFYWRQNQTDIIKDGGSFEDIIRYINNIMNKQTSGAVAILIPPTQPYGDNVFDIIGAVNNKKFKLRNRVCCPGNPEMFTKEMVIDASDKKYLLNIYGEIIVWEFSSKPSILK